MNSIKAIITGVVVIIVLTLLMQLAYLFISVSYHLLAKDYPYLNEMNGIFRYLIAIPAVLLIMFIGGYLTALVANSKIILHCLIVAIITVGGTMWMALENAELTNTGIVINLLMVLSTIAGGFYHLKRLNKANLS